MAATGIPALADSTEYLQGKRRGAQAQTRGNDFRSGGGAAARSQSAMGSQQQQQRRGGDTAASAISKMNSQARTQSAGARR